MASGATLLALLALGCLLPHLQAPARAARSYARYQRGDQGPDLTEGAQSGGPPGLAAPIGGPNVCRSQESSHCCPGWTQRGLTGLCLVPLCRDGRCGPEGRCVKPNLCICAGGRIMPRCHQAQGGSSSTTTTVEEGCRFTCLNGGTCTNGTCSCRPGYAGEYCQVGKQVFSTTYSILLGCSFFCQEPVCKEECENGGRCIGPNRCACVYGYTGRHCEIDYRTGPCYR